MKYILGMPVVHWEIVEGCQPTDALLGFARGPELVKFALSLGISKGCRITDDASGFSFRWRPA